MRLSTKLEKIIRSVSEKTLMKESCAAILPDTSPSEALRMGFNLHKRIGMFEMALYALSSAGIQHYFICKSEEELCTRAETWK